MPLRPAGKKIPPIGGMKRRLVLGNTATSVTAGSAQNHYCLASPGQGFGNDPVLANAALFGVLCPWCINYALPAGDCQQQ